KCGYEHTFFHSCCNRSCPKCHSGRTHKWLEKNSPKLLPVNYFHVVFTLPSELHSIVRDNQQVLYGCIFKAASYALFKLLAEPRFAGGIPGMISVLHTWSNDINFHPHVHFLIPAVVISKDKTKWLPIKKKFLVPMKALSEIYRARYMKIAREALPKIKFPQSVWKTQWVVYPKFVDYGPQKVLEYLARYLYRVAITNNRIVAYKDGNVTFKYKDRKTDTWKMMTLSAEEFMRRFLQHVLPRGFHKVRFYGFMASQYKDTLQSLRLKLPQSKENATQKSDPSGPYKNFRRCPKCKIGTMEVTEHVFHSETELSIGRAPP
ncbi:MAG: transposase, partial [bacterium]|nr:transposase [bacterium]